MNESAPFQPSDLEELDVTLLSRADAVVSVREAFLDGERVGTIAMRHDVDHASGAFECALAFGRWEAKRGYRSSYYLLHTARYWGSSEFADGICELESLGHEIGIHVDAVAQCLVVGGDPHDVLAAALETLRATGADVTGVVGHGNKLCHLAGFANDEQFLEAERENLGAKDRWLTWEGNELRLDPRPLADFGLEYEAVVFRNRNSAPTIEERPARFQTDSSGIWLHAPEQVVDFFPHPTLPLHMNLHPDHWTEAFPK